MTDAEKIAALEDRCAELREEITAQIDAWVDEANRLEDAEARIKILCWLIDQAMEHVPAITVYGIDQRTIGDALRDETRTAHP